MSNNVHDLETSFSICNSIIYEISMVPTKLLWNIHKQMSEISGTVDKTSFAGKNILICGDLYQLPLVMAKPVFQMKGQ